MSDFGHSIEGICAIGGLIVFVLGPLQWVSTDAARQHLFFLRDELFDMAHGGRLSFESEQYRFLRSTFDRQIRFAHLLNVWRFLIFARIVRRRSIQSKSVENVICEIDDQKTQQEVRALVGRMNSTITMMLFAKSPVLWFTVFILIIVGCPLILIKNLLDKQGRLKTFAVRDPKKLFGFLTASIASLVQREAIFIQ